MIKVLQILGVYAFALAAAVACAPNFTPKPAGTTIFSDAKKPTDPKSEPAAEFKPKFVKAARSAVDTKIAMDFAFTDSAKPISIRALLAKGAPGTMTQTPVDGVLYVLTAKCFDEACAEVVVSLDRVLKPSDEKAVAEQSVFYFVATDATYQLKNQLDQTGFDDMAKVAAALKPAAAGSGAAAETAPAPTPAPADVPAPTSTPAATPN